jgi:hypothetical protein
MLALWNAFGPWVTAGLGGFILAIFLFPTKLGEAFFKSRLDRTLELLKGQHQRDIENLRHELKAIDDRTSALRKASLEGFGTRSTAITQRKITAVENLWSAVAELTPYVVASKMTAPIKWDVALRAAHRSDEAGINTRKFAETYWQILKIEEFKPTIHPDRERPFLSETCWARFSLYRSVLTYPVAMLAAVKNGVSPELMNDPKPILDAIKETLPHYTQLIEEYGDAILPNVRDELQALVLQEIRNIVEGKSLDRDHLAQAKSIIVATDAFEQSLATAEAKTSLEIPAEIKLEECVVGSETKATAARATKKVRFGPLGKYLPIETDDAP